ncbi:hypothetical protein LCGC14_2718390, partial [marine sediment metagenome]
LDGAGIKYWQRVGRRVAFVTGRESAAVARRAAELGVTLLYQGAKTKLLVYEQLLAELKLTDEQVAVMGDDLVDLPMMRRSGFAIAPPGAVAEVRRGADLVTVHANGDTKRTASGSAFAGQKLKIELFREDDFVNQVSRFMEGEIVYLRGTMGMMNMAADVTDKDQRTRLVIVYQHSWSTGGDAFVVKRGIKSVKDLKGKTIAIQAYGPHVDYMTKLLSDAGLTIKDVNLVWTKDLVGPEGDTPMAKLYDENVDAAFVIIPDALALTNQGNVGTGAEDSARGAVIMLSTKTASRIINDVYAVRKDYFDQNRDEVRRFVQALMIAEEEVRDLYKAKSSRYNKMLSAAAGMILDSTGAIVDMEGMAFLDAEMARYDGNVKFFTDKNYPRNFSKLNNEIQTAYIGLGLIARKAALLQGNWDYSAFTGLRYANRV